MLRKIQLTLFLMSVALLPLGEWRIIGLPINHRPLIIDLDGFLSVSLFDLTFFVFSLSMLPTIAQAFREKRLFSWYLTYWVFGFALIAIVYATLKPHLPFLTPSQVNVIDVRNLIINCAVAAIMTVYVANVEIPRTIRFSHGFYLVSIAVFVVLSALAFSTFMYFQTHYPFVIPTQISFPFQSQNVAAPFAAICLLGLLGTAITLQQGAALVVGIPVLILAAALTGSRSNMLCMAVTAAAFCAAYALHGRRLTAVSAAPSWHRNFTFIAAGMVGAVAVLAINIDWQPIRRALSIFDDISAKPAALLIGERGSPRRELWSTIVGEGSPTAGARVDASDAVENREFGMGLVTVSGGCKTEGPLILNLVPGMPYFVRLTLRRDARPAATLEVFSDPHHKHLVGRQNAPLPAAALPHLYLLVSDSGSRRYKHFEGELDGFSIAANGAIGGEMQIETGSADLYEDPYNGGATPLLERASGRIGMRAKVKQLRAYVNRPNTVPASATRVVLTYQVSLSTVYFTLPIDPPVLFYTGFHDTEAGAGDAAWKSIRNGVLIQHARAEARSPSEDAYHDQDDRYKYLDRRAHEQYAGLTHDEFVKKIDEEIKCGEGQAQKIANLWKKPISPEMMGKTPEESFGARITSDKPVKDQISVLADSAWSTVDHLNDGGSTHNVYLDWYYYVGPGPLAVFVLFVASLLTAFAVFTWKHRCSPYFNFYLAVLLQLVVIFAMMYAQPNIWVKYFWFVMGIASGLMVNRTNRGADSRPLS